MIDKGLELEQMPYNIRRKIGRDTEAPKPVNSSTTAWFKAQVQILIGSATLQLSRNVYQRTSNLELLEKY